MFKSEPERSQAKAKTGFVTVCQCRMCGAVIPLPEGVERHGQVCRINNEINIRRPDIQLMNRVKFPCPTVAIKRLSVDNVGKSEGIQTATATASPIPKRSSPWKNSKYLSSGQLGRPNKVPVKQEQESTFMKYEDEDSNENVNVDDEGKSTDSESGNTPMETDHRPPTVTGYLNVAHRYTCPLKGCSSAHESPHKVKQHFVRHLQNNPYSCPIPKCKVVCDSLSKFQRHINIHLHLGRDGVIKVSCEKCGRCYIGKDNLRKHWCPRRNPTRPSPRADLLKCSVDEMIGYLKSRHINIKHPKNIKTETFTEGEGKLPVLMIQKINNIDQIIEKDPVFIQICKEQPKFKELILKRSLLKRRQDKMQPSKNERLECSQCEKTFQNVKYYDEHQLQAHTPRPFKCKICQRDFHKKVYLQKHLKLFECKLDKKYIKKLRSGMWACTKCGHEAPFPDQIKKHWGGVHKIRIPSHRKSDLAKGHSFSNPAQTKKSDLKTASAEERERSGMDMDVSIVKIESEPPVQLVINVIESAEVEELDRSLKVERSAANDSSESYQDFKYGIADVDEDACKMKDEDVLDCKYVIPTPVSILIHLHLFIYFVRQMTGVLKAMFTKLKAND